MINLRSKFIEFRFETDQANYLKVVSKFLLLFCLISVHNGLKVSIQPLLMLLAIANPELSTYKRFLKNAIKPAVGSKQLQPS